MKTPTLLAPEAADGLRIEWGPESAYLLNYVELRYYCPCAACVDEHTGQRTVQKTDVAPDVRVMRADPIGRYAVQFHFSDGHRTGVYHFDRLWELSVKTGMPLTAEKSVNAPSP